MNVDTVAYILLGAAGLFGGAILWDFRGYVAAPFKAIGGALKTSPAPNVPQDTRCARHAALCLWSDYADAMSDETEQAEVIGAIELLAMYSTGGP